MHIWREEFLRGPDADAPTIAMLDLWRSLTEEKLGVPIGVVAADRREHPNLKDFQGELHTALPLEVEGKVALCLWLDTSTGPIEDVIITHEIGHWVLKLQGFHAFRYQPSPSSNVEVSLNSMASHPALYALQRTLGHEPQSEVDARAEHDVTLFSRDSEPSSEDTLLANALLIADDSLNCSEVIREQLGEVVSTKHPKTSKHLANILETSSHYDLSTPRSSARFLRRLVRNLKLGSEWIELDELPILRDMVQNTS